MQLLSSHARSLRLSDHHSPHLSPSVSVYHHHSFAHLPSFLSLLSQRDCVVPRLPAQFQLQLPLLRKPRSLHSCSPFDDLAAKSQGQPFFEPTFLEKERKRYTFLTRDNSVTKEKNPPHSNRHHGITTVKRKRTQVVCYIQTLRKAGLSPAFLLAFDYTTASFRTSYTRRSTSFHQTTDHSRSELGEPI